MPESVDELWTWFVALWPPSLQPYILLILAAVGSIAAILSFLNSIIDFLSKIRGGINTSVPIEQYRGNLIAKFKGFFDSLDAELAKIRKRPKFPIVYGAPNPEHQIEYLLQFRAVVVDVKTRCFEALDKKNIVLAHEILNELRVAAQEIATEIEEHSELFERSKTMDPGGGGFHGTHISLRQAILSCLTPLTSEIEKSEPNPVRESENGVRL